jgi:hypothetical protein
MRKNYFDMNIIFCILVLKTNASNYKLFSPCFSLHIMGKMYTFEGKLIYLLRASKFINSHSFALSDWARNPFSNEFLFEDYAINSDYILNPCWMILAGNRALLTFPQHSNIDVALFRRWCVFYIRMGYSDPFSHGEQDTSVCGQKVSFFGQKYRFIFLSVFCSNRMFSVGNPRRPHCSVGLQNKLWRPRHKLWL